jgi:N-6 DNA Methylase
MSGAGADRRDTGQGTGRRGGRAAALTTGTGTATGTGAGRTRRPRERAPAAPAPPTGRTAPTGPAGPAAPVAATVAAADIARLAGVGRAAVSNWRRRFPDFPDPVGGTAASPLYSLAEVEAWFARHGRQLRVSLGDRIWQHVQATVDDLRLGELVGLLGAFLVLLQRRPQAWAELAGRPDPEVAAGLPAAVAAAVPELPGQPETGAGTIPSGQSTVDSEWVPVVRAVADLAAEHGPAGAFDFLCGRYLDAHTRRLPVTPPGVAEFMVGLLGLTLDAPAGTGGAGLAGVSVLDPACGVGTLLFAAARAGADRLAGQEVRDSSARLALTRLLLHGADARVEVGDSLLADAWGGELADAVVCNPPFNERSWGYDELASDPRWEYGLPPRGESELAWVQHCLAHARPGGQVVVAMPAAAANRRPGRRIRGNLLRSGALRAVVGIPAAAPSAPAAPDLWVLRRPDPSGTNGGAPSHVLMVDAAPDLTAVREAWQAFVADPEQPPPGPSASVRIIDLLDDEVDVSPRRHVKAASTGPVSVVDHSRTRERLAAVLARLSQLLPDLAPGQGGREPAMTTVGELARAGVVSIEQAPLRMTTQDGELPVLTVNDVRLGRAPSGRTVRQPGLVTVAPGDVVTPVVVRDPVARVVIEGGAVLGPQLLCFRADPERMDPHFLAGFLRLARFSGAVRASTGSLRIDARKAPIPLVPPGEQRGYGEAFRRLVEFEDLLREAGSLGADLVRLGFAGLAHAPPRP